VTSLSAVLLTRPPKPLEKTTSTPCASRVRPMSHLLGAMARRKMAAVGRIRTAQRRHLGAAAGDRHGAAVVEGASWKRIEQRRPDAWNALECRRFLEGWQRLDEHPGVGMARSCEDAAHRARLHQPAR